MLWRIRVFMSLQPEAEPVDVSLVCGELVPWLELLMRLVGEDVQISAMFAHQWYRVVQRNHIFLFGHLHQDWRLDLVQVGGRGKKPPTLGGFILCAKRSE